MRKDADTAIHEEIKSKDNPETGEPNYDSGNARDTEYLLKGDRNQPHLIWTNKDRKDVLKVPVVTLRSIEKVNPGSVLGNLFLKQEPAVQDKRDGFTKNKIPEENPHIQFYQHGGRWANRLILGDSLLIMNALLENEGMANQIKMIYIDPPYGIDFKSNFQIFVNDLDMKDDDNSLTREVEQIQAFRDTWKYGIHSYLDYLRDRVIVGKKLLDDTGSLFVQIGMANFHYVFMLLEEIFGPENLVSIISFRKKGSTSTRLLPTMNDFIIWFAKDKRKVKINTLYVDKIDEMWGFPEYAYIQTEGGSFRELTRPERFNPRSIESYEKRIFKLVGILNPDPTSSEGTQVNMQQQQILIPPGFRLGISMELLEQLASEKRLVLRDGHLYYKSYLGEEPVAPLSNFWENTRGEMAMRYVVQTAERIVERCVLMATNPGDLILDPTCGSGTTAVVAERYGRRWITFDTSRIAINLTRTRLLLQLYKYFELKDPKGPIEFVPTKKTIKHLVRNRGREEAELVVDNVPLLDKPKSDNTIIRVSGPFTTETLATAQISDPGHAGDKNWAGFELFLNKVAFYLELDGVHHIGGGKVSLKEIKASPDYSEGIHFDGKLEKENGPLALVSVGPEFSKVNRYQVEKAIAQATTRRAKRLFVLGFSFDEAAQLKINTHNANAGAIRVEQVFINPDIEIDDLEKKVWGQQMFSAAGTPRIKINRIDDGNTLQVALESVEVFNPQLGRAQVLNPNRIYCIMIDENFDDENFEISQILFPKMTQHVIQNEKSVDPAEKDESGVVDDTGEGRGGKEDSETDQEERDETESKEDTGKTVKEKKKGLEVDMSVRKFLKALQNSSNANVIDQTKLALVTGNISLPFKVPSRGQIALKIVDLRGIEIVIKQPVPE